MLFPTGVVASFEQMQALIMPMQVINQVISDLPSYSGPQSAVLAGGWLRPEFFYWLIYEPSYCNFPESRKKIKFIF